MKYSDATYALFVRGELLALFGIAHWPGTPPHTVGNAWLLTTTAVERHKLAFARAARPAVRVLLGHYPVLVNVVDARYTKAVAWLARLGFEVREPSPSGVEQRPFHTVFLRGEKWAA